MKSVKKPPSYKKKLSVSSAQSGQHHRKRGKVWHGMARAGNIRAETIEQYEDFI